MGRGRAGMRRLLALLSCAVLAALLGSCGGSGETAQVKTVTVETRVAAPPPAPRRTRKSRNATPTQSAFVSCDANVEVKAETTSCGFAQNVFWHYWTSGEAQSLDVYSPATKATLATNCTASGGRVSCATSDGGEVRFPRTALDTYSTAQADNYAATHDLGPDPYESLDGAGPSTSHSQTTPAPETPSTGEDIPNYPNGRGNRIQCADGMYSQSGGIQGACSGHGGVR